LFDEDEQCQWSSGTHRPQARWSTRCSFRTVMKKRIGASYPTYPPFRMIQRLKIYLKPILLLASNYNLNLVTGTITEGHLALKPHLCTWRRSSLRNRRTSSVICGRAPAMHFCCRCARPIPGRRPAFVPEFLEALETNQDCNAFFETVLMSSSIWLLKNFLVVLRMCVLFRWPMRQLSLSLELDGRKNGCGKWQAGHAYVTTAPPDVSAPCGVFIDCID